MEQVLRLQGKAVKRNARRAFKQKLRLALKRLGRKNKTTVSTFISCPMRGTCSKLLMGDRTPVQQYRAGGAFDPKNPPAVGTPMMAVRRPEIRDTRVVERNSRKRNGSCKSIAGLSPSGKGTYDSRNTHTGTDKPQMWDVEPAGRGECGAENYRFIKTVDEQGRDKEYLC